MSEPDPGVELSRPPTRLERAGLVFARVSGIAGIVVVVLLLIFAVLVGVPAISVARSDAYAAARAAVSRHSLVRRAFGDAEVTCERVPRRYSVERDHAQFEFLVTGDPEDERSSDGTKHWAATEVARDASGVWHVTSAAFSWRRERRTTQVQLPLARSDAAPVGSGSK